MSKREWLARFPLTRTLPLADVLCTTEIIPHIRIWERDIAYTTAYNNGQLKNKRLLNN